MPINNIKDTSIFWTCSAAVVLATVHANEIFPLQTTFECLFCHYNIFIYVIIVSFYIFFASSVALIVLLLKKPEPEYDNTFKRDFKCV